MIIVKTDSCSSFDMTPEQNQYLDALVWAEEHDFNLNIPMDNHNEDLSENKFRMSRKSFAIVCYSDKTKEDIMKHIQREFHTHIQYICISSRSPESHVMPSTSPYSSRIFIQIILKKAINKKTFFLKDIAGRQCNYRVTSNDRAWHSFLKKVGPYIEDGIFKSISSRTGTKWSKNVQKKQQLSVDHLHNSIIENSTSTIFTYDYLLNKVTESIQEAMDSIKKQIPIEHECQQNNIYNRLNILYLVATAPLLQ